MTGTGLDTQVAVVGAGPAGLLLAGELRLHGIDVIVFEQLAAPTQQSRASTLHARTMEILHSRDLLAAFGNPPVDPRGHFGGIPLDLTTSSRWSGQWKVPQAVTEEILQDRAWASGARILRGYRVTGLTYGQDHVLVDATGPHRPLRMRAGYLVACDGENSTVRELIGAGFPGHGERRRLLRADVAGLEIQDRRFERLPAGLAIASRRPDGVTRVMVHEYGEPGRPGRGTPDFTTIAGAWKNVTGEDISHGEPLWLNAFGDTNRQLERYRHGRVLFAGDAAHRQMPSGGQALNLALQDAFNLGWKLAATAAGRAPAGLLDSYHSERHPVGRRVLANIETQGLLLLGGPGYDPVRALLRELLEVPAARAHLTAMISGIDVRYDVGPDPDPRLGARLAEPPGPAPGGGSLLAGGRGVLFAQHSLGPAVTADGWSDRVDTHLVTAPPAPGAAAVLVRPDGHVAWLARSGDPAPDGLSTALHRWFGAPTPASGPRSRSGSRKDRP